MQNVPAVTSVPTGASSAMRVTEETSINSGSWSSTSFTLTSSAAVPVLTLPCDI